MRERYLTTLFWIPPLLVLGIFELFLGHRHDYSGHYLAGYGATFIAAMLGIRMAQGKMVERYLSLLIIPFCLLCILGGIITESTIFRLAKFDEVDFFNQSLGAVLAMMVVQQFVSLLLYVETPTNPQDISGPIIASSTASASKENMRWCDGGIILGVIYLGIGGVLAFA